MVFNQIVVSNYLLIGYIHYCPWSIVEFILYKGKYVIRIRFDLIELILVPVSNHSGYCFFCVVATWQFCLSQDILCRDEMLDYLCCYATAPSLLFRHSKWFGYGNCCIEQRCWWIDYCIIDLTSFGLVYYCRW